MTLTLPAGWLGQRDRTARNQAREDKRRRDAARKLRRLDPRARTRLVALTGTLDGLGALPPQDMASLRRLTGVREPGRLLDRAWLMVEFIAGGEV